MSPIYFSSLILGSFYHNEHLSRAIIARCASVPNLPPPYLPHSPLLSGITASEGRVPGKAPSFAINWKEGDQDIEVVTTVKGKTEAGLPSKLCKHEMYCLYTLARHSLTVKKDVLRCENINELTYSEAKDLNVSYREAKRAFSDTCETRGLGKWLGKPREQEDFTLKEAAAAATAVVNAAAATAGAAGRLTRLKQAQLAAGEDDQDERLTGCLFAEDFDGDCDILENGGQIQQLQGAIPPPVHSGSVAINHSNDYITQQIREIRCQSDSQSREN